MGSSNKLLISEERNADIDYETSAESEDAGPERENDDEEQHIDPDEENDDEEQHTDPDEENDDEEQHTDTDEENGDEEQHTDTDEENADEEIAGSDEVEEIGDEANAALVQVVAGDSQSKSGDNGLKARTCEECGKIFPSNKAKYGHMRSHRKKAGKIPAYQAALGQVAPPVSNEAVITRADIVGACDLVFLASKGGAAVAADSRILNMPRKITDDETMGTTRKKGRNRNSGERTYACASCNKIFSSHQALGGHVASHNNKNRNNAEAVGMLEEIEEAVGPTAEGRVDPNGAAAAAAAAAGHKCKQCCMSFSKGQALGGHMRKHYPGPANRAATGTGNRDPSPPPSAPSSESADGENHRTSLENPVPPSPPATPPSESQSKVNHPMLDVDLNETPEDLNETPEGEHF